MRRLRLVAATALSLAAVAGCGTTVHRTAAGASAPGDATLSVPTGQAPAGSTPGGPGGSSPAGVVPGSTATAPGTSAVGSQVIASTGPGTSTVTTPTTGPIKVGFMYSINDAAPSAGVNSNQTITPGNVMHALVDDYNKAGGFAGRHIQPVYEELRSSSNDFEGDLAAACASFTQDNHVAAVFVGLGYFSESFDSCLAKAGVPEITIDTGPDLHDARAWPLLVTPDEMLGDSRLVQVVDRLHDTGWLTSHDRMGVVIEGCPVNQRIYTVSLRLELRRLGIPVAATASPHCFQAIGDLGAISAEMGSAVIRFRQSGVSKVIVVSAGQEGTMTYEFMLAAGNQGWYPGYALSSASFPTTLQAQSGVPQREFENARGIGWEPPSDTVQHGDWTASSATRDCTARVTAQGLHPSTAVDQLAVQGLCDIFDLYDSALRGARGDASAAAIVPGMQRAGSTHISGLTLNGTSSFWDHGRLAPAEGRFFQYIPARGGFVYIGQPFRFGE